MYSVTDYSTKKMCKKEGCLFPPRENYKLVTVYFATGNCGCKSPSGKLQHEIK